jgi:hypothetical protein
MLPRNLAKIAALQGQPCFHATAVDAEPERSPIRPHCDEGLRIKDYGGGITAWVILEYPLSPLGSTAVVA